jgi:hypothetical protein
MIFYHTSDACGQFLEWSGDSGPLFHYINGQEVRGKSREASVSVMSP